MTVPFDCCLIVIAKEPLPGRVKTRLTPYFTPQQAAELAAAALADTLAAVLAAVALGHRAQLSIEPVLVLQGEPGPWLDGCVEGGKRMRVIPQSEGGLDARLAAAFADATAGRVSAAGLLIGMDTPQVSPHLLVDAIAALSEPDCDAVLGLALDGGWWAMGLRQPDADLLLGVPMSTAATGAEQEARLVHAGLAVTPLPRLLDVDTAETAMAVARSAPRGRFAATLHDLIAPTDR